MKGLPCPLSGPVCLCVGPSQVNVLSTAPQDSEEKRTFVLKEETIIRPRIFY